MEQDNLDQQLEEARQISLDIDEGMRSRYWKHLRRKIDGWLTAEEKHLKVIDFRLIRTQEELEDRNDSVKRIDILRTFLKINETIRDENLSVLASVEVPEKHKRSTNFVGSTHETQNGR